jgi:hypothetical protein
MTKWLLIVYIAADLPLPILAYDTEDECYQALAQWEFQPGVRGTCLEGRVDDMKKKRTKRTR